MPDNFLEHYGKKGMKWGVRKDRKSGKGKSAGQTAKTLSDKELKKRVKRLNMEKQYTDLVKTEASSMAKGKSIVTDMLVSAGKQKAQSLTTSAVSKVVDIGIAAAVTKVKKARS
jgi:hypothetical protein